MNSAGQTICLNMIVKNEAPVIARCLNSLRHLIDHWVIVDTGSTDGTQALIRELMADIPGELHESPWVNFAVNRSEALRLARGKADYVLTIDADEILSFDPGHQMPALTADGYMIRIDFGGYRYVRKQLVNNSLDWRYEGILHEYVVCDQPASEAVLEGAWILPRHDGARARDPMTYKRDSLVLEQALIDEPDNARHAFYLAQSYRDAGDIELAIRWYRKRAAMGGWTEEVWCALYQLASLRERRGDDWPEVMQDYLSAWQVLPDRAEPLFRIGVHYQKRSEHHLSHLFLSRLATIERPDPRRLFVEAALYEYEAALELAVACFYVGDHANAIRINNALLRNDALPPHVRLQVVQNRRFSLDALAEVLPGEAADRRVHVLIPTHDETGLDETIESLGAQTTKPFAVVAMAAAGSDTPAIVTAALEAESIQVWTASIADYVARHVDPQDLVVQLRPAERLAHSEALAQMAAAFADPGCFAAFGRRRMVSGRIEPTEPWTGREDFAARQEAAIGDSNLMLRGDLARALSSDWSARGVLKHAGFTGSRYRDELWTIAAAPSPPAAPKPRAQRPPATPMVSCLMVTHDRLSLAKRAVRSYADQTYPHRELIIVNDGPAWRRHVLRDYAIEVAPNVRFVEPAESGATLGKLRNLAIEAASGEVVCQWDDDDVSHPERLAIQHADMTRQKAQASLMTEHLHFLEDQNLLCWVDWAGGQEVFGPGQLAPGTLMMNREGNFRYPETGPLAKQGEDSVMLELLYRAVKVAPLRDSAPLYLYTYHGRNTFSRDHHYRVGAHRASVDRIRDSADSIRAAGRVYGLPKPCFVMGREGLAFVL